MLLSLYLKSCQLCLVSLSYDARADWLCCQLMPLMIWLCYHSTHMLLRIPVIACRCVWLFIRSYLIMPTICSCLLSNNTNGAQLIWHMLHLIISIFINICALCFVCYQTMPLMIWFIWAHAHEDHLFTRLGSRCWVSWSYNANDD